MVAPINYKNNYQDKVNTVKMREKIRLRYRFVLFFAHTRHRVLHVRMYVRICVVTGVTGISCFHRQVH